MKTKHAAGRKKPEASEPQTGPAPFEWKKAVPPRIVGKNHARAGEWRPGEQAHRGYEKAVEEWWWI
jgi:hypothetical protein